MPAFLQFLLSLLVAFIVGLLIGWWLRGTTGVGKAQDPVSPMPAPKNARAAPVTMLGIPAAVGAPDDLTRIAGIGPRLNVVLQNLGVRRFDQIAAWGAEEIARVDSHLGAFKGRIDRDNWVEQARLLASGAIEEWNRRFGGGTNT